MNKKRIVVMTSLGPIVCNFSASSKEIIDEAIKSFKSENIVKEPKEPPKDLDYYLNKVAKRNNMSFDKMDGFLCKLHSISPVSAVSILLREIAIEMDLNYEGHINDCEYVYAVSYINGKITRIKSSSCKNFRNFAAFRTEEDAKEALKILGECFKNLFKYSGK